MITFLQIIMGLIISGMIALVVFLGVSVYEEHQENHKIKHKKVDGHRWIKFYDEPWQHNPNCDNKCHNN